MRTETLIIGAGIAGLSCARTLASAGRDVTVLERAAGVGGRCATRRVHGVPIDHGVTFLHGDSPEFLRALESVEGAHRLAGWPARVEGSGAPCQPSAFARGAHRVAFEEGVSVFPKSLARGLDVRVRATVTSISERPAGFSIELDDGAVRESKSLVLALATEQTHRLMQTLMAPGDRSLEAVAHIVGGMGSKACLTVLAGYGDREPPSWDLALPERSAVLQLVSNERSKRPSTRQTILVLQGRPCWSRQRLAGPVEDWTRELLAAAAEVAGPWAAAPDWADAHCWRYARSDGGCELTGPIWLPRAAGGGIGFAGEIFGAGGGVESAWTSGVALARRLLGEER